MNEIRATYKDFDALPVPPLPPRDGQSTVVEEKVRPGEYRNPFQRDRDRILYSMAFRRLAGVTQVAEAGEHALLHNRLTHSLKVGQLAREMAQWVLHAAEGKTNFDGALSSRCIRYLPDVAETAGLAHDLGHPPFGHTAEEVLATAMERYGGFEGNAQSFRIVTKLASRQAVPNYGLNLSRASLNGILKYPTYIEKKLRKEDIKPWTDRSRGAKWGVYHSESREFDHARALSSGDPRPEHIRSVAAILMDWADDVSYGTHDLHDYHRSGLVPLYRLEELDKSSSVQDFLTFVQERDRRYDMKALEGAYKRIQSHLMRPSEPFEDTRDQRVQINRFVSTLINKYVRAVVPIEQSPYVKVKSAEQYEVEILKSLMWYHVIMKPALEVSREGQRQIVRRLFETLTDLLARSSEEIRKGKHAAVPITLQELYIEIIEDQFQQDAQEVQQARAVCDYICGLTEDQAVNLYERLTGLSVSRSSIFGAWFH